MHLRNTSDQTILNEIKKLVQQEREVLTEILHHLREIERRRLFSKLKFASLLDYAVRELNYSEDQAFRRISAMRLMRDVPWVEKQIATGRLSLTNAGLAQRLISKEKKAGRPMDQVAKSGLLENLLGKTSRQAQTIVAAINPEMKSRTLSFNQIDDDLLREKLLRLKGRYAHSHPYMTLTELLHKICDALLEEKVPSKVVAGSQAEIFREVHRRAGHKCTHCGSVHALEIDHIVPQSMGGPSTLENLRLLCRPCNQRAAIEKLGGERMSRYLKSPTVRYG